MQDEKSAIEYVAKQKELGWSEEQIRQGLVQMGWEQMQADFILTKVKLTQSLDKSRDTIKKYKVFRIKLAIICLVIMVLMYLVYLYFPRK